MNLLVEIHLHTPGEKEISQETPNFHKKLHAEPSTTLPKLYRFVGLELKCTSFQ